MIQIVETFETLQICRQLNPCLLSEMIQIQALFPCENGHIVGNVDLLLIRRDHTESVNGSRVWFRLDALDRHIVQDRLVADRLIGIVDGRIWIFGIIAQK